MVIYQRIVVAVLLFGGAYFSLQGMNDAQRDVPLKLVGVPEIFNLTDQQINETRFYQAICEGHIKLVRGMVRYGKINPRKVLTWHSLFIFGFGQDGKPGQIGYLPITYRSVYADPHKFKDLQRHTEQFLPLTLAVAQNQFDIVRFLVETCKVNINGCRKGISHPLHVAIDGENIDIVQYLIDHGANPLYKDDCVHHHTVLESVDWGLACPVEIGPKRIAKLQKIRPIIVRALKTRKYPDPYLYPDRSSVADPQQDTGDDQNLIDEFPDVSDDSGGDDTDQDADNSDDLVAKSPSPLPSSSSRTSGAPGLPNSSCANSKQNPNGPNLPPVPHQQAPRVAGAQHGLGRPVVSTQYSWKIVAGTIVGVACGIIGIKRLYIWYASGDEQGDKTDQTTAQKESDTIV